MRRGRALRHRLGGAAAAVGIAIVLGPSAPAAADAPRPTDYESTVLSVEPALPDGAEIRVVGGDSLLELTVPDGHTAVVADYAASDADDAVPYLRFRDDGTVQRNANAVATTANEARYGTSDRTPNPSAAPRWETVSTDGSYAWHDHRIHWMSPAPPRAVAEDGLVDLGGPDGTWEVPITVDDTPTVVTGQLVIVDAPSPVGPVLLSLVVAAATVAIGLRGGLRLAAVVTAVIAAAAVPVAWATWQAVPAGAGASMVPVAIAGVALIASIAAVLVPDRVRLIPAAAAAAALVGWGLARWTVLARAVLPTTLAPAVDRGVTAAALGAGLGLAVVLVWRPTSRPAGGRTHAPADGQVTASPSA